MENNHFKNIEEILLEMRKDAEKLEIKKDIAGSIVNVVKERQYCLLIRYVKLLTAVSVILIMGNIIQGLFLVNKEQKITEVKEEPSCLTNVVVSSSVSPKKSSTTITAKVVEIKPEENHSIKERKNTPPGSEIEEIFKLYSLISGFPSISIQEIMPLQDSKEQTKGGGYDRV
ncbi:MAG TPA: hypothetical protein PLQ41_03810 [bacterium]|nr:hypothetical protein [bacterium]HPP30215.1 hypothetical protein [bacterium]